MTTHLRLLTPVATAAMALALVGCEDEAARVRDAVQQDLVKAASTLHGLNVATADADEATLDDVRRQLNGVVSDLKSIRGGESGQQAARSLMLSTALRDLAALDLEMAGEIEGELWRDLAVGHAKLDAAGRLAARARGLDEISVDAERQYLRRDRDGAEGTLRESAGNIQELESPIQNLNREITADRGEIDQLEMQANELRREAARAGAAPGFESFEQAVDVERRADQIRYEVAQREIELGYDLQPRMAYWSTRRDQAQRHVDSVDASLRDLDELVRQYESSADAANATAQRLHDEVVATLEAAAQLNEETLGPLYEQATRNLEEAAGQADQAASKMGRDEASAARLAAARAQAARGRALAARADGLVARRSLAARLADESEMYRRAVSDLETSYDEAMDAALASYQAARGQLERVQSRTVGPALEAFKSSLDSTIAVLEGAPLESAPTLSLAPPSGGGAPAGSSSGGGFPTADALLEFINGLVAAGPQQLPRLVDAIHAESDASRELVELLRVTAGPSARFAEAMSNAFGEAGMPRQAMGGGMGLGGMEGATIQNRTPDRVTISIAMEGQPPSMTDLVRVDGSWKIDGDTLMPAFTNLPPQQREMARDAALASVQMFDGLIARIEAGEFSSPQEVLQVMMQEMMKSAGGAGAPGGATPPGR